MNDMTEKELKDGGGASYTEMLRRDRRRWSRVDSDSDGKLSRAEFAEFLHPEESPRLHDIVVAETMEDVDKDKDGKVSEEEYIGDMYRGHPGRAEPEWVVEERRQFRLFFDVLVLIF